MNAQNSVTAIASATGLDLATSLTAIEIITTTLKDIRSITVTETIARYNSYQF
jgi:hypothetical protein